MASKLQHTVSYPFSTARLWAIYTTEKYWHDLVERMNSGHGHVEKVTITGDTVTVDPPLSSTDYTEFHIIGTAGRNRRSGGAT